MTPTKPPRQQRSEALRSKAEHLFVTEAEVSSRDLAKRLGLSNSTVADWRKEWEAKR